MMKHAEKRNAVITYLRGNDWTSTYDMWQHLRISSGKLYVILTELVRDGVVEAQFEKNPLHGKPARRFYRLRENIPTQ